MMRLRLGFVVGLGLGYYLGAMAGRERYEQLNRLIGKVKRSDATHTAAGKAKSVMGSGLHKATDEVKYRVHHNGHADTGSYSPN